MSIFLEGIFDRPLVFVDIETNGLNHVRGRVIEVAALRVESGVITREFRSLIDPETELPQFITNLTGIASNDLLSAPTFRQIADELYDVLDGAIFVAHNVRFDYSFLKQEFGRVGQTFLPKQLCTVKLSRALYPAVKGHKLEDLIRRHNLSYSARHRAYDDAAALWQFLQHVGREFPQETIASAVKLQLRSPARPKNLEQAMIQDLPDGPGVYIFEDDSGQPLYVGKSINIKQRVLSHFGRDHAEAKEFKIAQQIHSIRTEQTAGELSALLLEAHLVKELQPLYNRRLRRKKKLLLCKQAKDDNGYTHVSLEEAALIDPAEAAQLLAVYPQRGHAKRSLTDMTKTLDLCPKLMGLERGDGACFLYQLHKCRGACVGKEPAQSYNVRLELAFERQRMRAWPYAGPVLIEEQADNEHSRAIIVDQWCVIGEVSREPYCEPVVHSFGRVFDLDTYKILQSHFSHKLKSLSIKPISPQQLSQLGL